MTSQFIVTVWDLSGGFKQATFFFRVGGFWNFEKKIKGVHFVNNF